MIAPTADSSIWIGFVTLIVLEVVLGINNLVFIAMLADKLPSHQRNRARIIGLSLAPAMRVVLLFSIFWIVTLTRPLFSVGGLDFSGRDIILILGGVEANALRFEVLSLEKRTIGKVRIAMIEHVEA